MMEDAHALAHRRFRVGKFTGGEPPVYRGRYRECELKAKPFKNPNKTDCPTRSKYT